MSPPPSSSGRKESINAKTPGKKRTNEEMSEPLAGSQASKTSAPPAGKAVNGLPKAAESGQETSAGDAKGSKNPDTEGAKNRNENGVIVASETKTPEQPFDPRQEIDNFNWQEFESRYLAAMAEQDEIQSALQEEFRKRINVRTGNCIVIDKSETYGPLVLQYMGTIGSCT